MNIVTQSTLNSLGKAGVLLLISAIFLIGPHFKFTSQTNAATRSDQSFVSSNQDSHVWNSDFWNNYFQDSHFRSSSFDCTTATQRSSSECQSLIDLYNNTDGKNWHTATGWLSDPDPCNWYGIMCNKKGSVLTLNLGNNNLAGPLPETLGRLESLQMLGLWNNRLSGTIPATLGQLTELSVLDLSKNNLTGNIPQELGNLSELRTLWLSDNGLSGSVPATLESLRNIISLHIERNQLSGTLPSGLTELPKNEELTFSYNALETEQIILRFAEDDHNVRTQTVAPNDLHIVKVQKDSATLAWTPIDYATGNGLYEISYRTATAPAYTTYSTTSDKSVSRITVNGLLPNTTYQFIIRTYTQPHLLQKNAIWSEYSEAVTQTTAASSAVVATSTPTATPTPPSDLIITALEVTQGLQNLTNDMPLVANRKTWVRVYAKSDISDVAGVRAQLRAFKGGNELVGSPLTMKYDPVTVRTDGGSRLNLEDNFQFVLPASWLTGAITFQAELNHDAAIQESNQGNNLWQETVSFQLGEPLSLVMVPIKLHKDGDSSQPPLTYKTSNPDFKMLIANSYRYMPVSTIEWREHSQTLEPDCDGPCNVELRTDPKPILEQLEAMRLQHEQISNFYETANNEHWVGMVDPEFSFGGLGIRPQKPFWQEYSAWASITSVYTASYASPYEIGGSLAMMHEIGHNLGLMHIDCGANEPNVAFGYPYAASTDKDCSLDQVDESGFYGFDVYYAAAGLDKPMVISNDPATDKANKAYPMMSYKFPGWPSPYKYCQLLIKFSVECNLYTYENAGAIVVGMSEEPSSVIDLGDIHFGLESRANSELPKKPSTDKNQVIPYRGSESFPSETHIISQRIIEVDRTTGEGNMELVTVQEATYGVAASNGQMLYYVPQTTEVFDEVISYTLSDKEGQLTEYKFEVPPPAASANNPSIMLPLIMNE